MNNYHFIYSNSLMHYGIRGQQWGVRNGPPYPLDAEDHSAVEKKAQSKKRLAKKFLKIGAAVVITGAAAYGFYKYTDIIKSQAIRIGQEECEKLEQNTEFIKSMNTRIEAITNPIQTSNLRPSKNQTNIKSKSKDLENFIFERVTRIDANGQESSISLPVDREGYAKAFAEKMSSSNPSDYDYWYNYLIGRMKYQ